MPFTCPQCGITSWNPNDAAEGYCGRCHWWTGVPGLAEILDQPDVQWVGDSAQPDQQTPDLADIYLIRTPPAA